MREPFLLMLSALVLAGCASEEGKGTAATARDTVSQATRDSAVARSGLPGARGVGRAQDAARAAQERATQLDSIP
jgi:hypothetical protein